MVTSYENVLENEELCAKAYSILEKLINNEAAMTPCRVGEDTFDHHLKCHELSTRLLHIPSSFWDFNRHLENRALFDVWSVLMASSMEAEKDSFWQGVKIRDKHHIASLTRDQISTGKWQFFLFGNFLKGRGRRFQLSPTLSSVLMYTDVKIPAEELRLPCAFMAVKLPPGLLNMVEHGRNPVDCQYLLITRQTLRTEEAKLRVQTTQGDLFPEGASEYLAVLAISEPRGDDKFGDLTLVDTVALREGKTVDEEIQNYVERRKIHRLGDHLQVKLPEGKVKYGNPVANIFALAANIILYSTNRGADIVAHNQPTLDRLQRQLKRHPKGKKRGRVLQKLQEARSQSIHIIGGGFKPKDGRVAEFHKSPHTLSVRHLVRGHWKMQAHGPGRKERKHIFVEPYWRGPELAEVVNRDYTLR